MRLATATTTAPDTQPAAPTVRKVRIDWRQHERDLIRGMLENLLDLAGRELDGRYQRPPLVGLVALPEGLLIATSPRDLPPDDIEHLISRAVAELANRG